MRHVRTSESIWDYEHRDNFLVIPITGFVRKDNGLAFTHPLAKEAEERYPGLSRRWGYLFKSGVVAPTHRTKNLNLIGMKEKDHYAAGPSEESVITSLYLINDLSTDNRDYIFYLYGFLGGDKFADKHEEILTSDRVVLLSPETHEDTIQSL